ncbi:MAG: PAS domain S-box protein [Proteobacteria bacterium]|nr:PAS domain S-box protein [Pseudomonadota bacterium]
MMPFVSMSLRAAVPIFLIGFAGLMVAVSLFHSVPKVEREMEEKAYRSASDTLTHLRSTLEYLYRRGDLERARQEVVDTGFHPEHKIVLVLDANDSIIASTRPAWLDRPIAEIEAPYDAAAAREARKGRHVQVILAPDRRSFLGYASLRLEGEGDASRPSGTGVVFFELDISRAKVAARRHVLGPDLYAASALGALAVLFWLGSHFIVARRLARLLDAAEKLAGGDLTACSGLKGGDELGRMSRAFDNVTRQIADAQARLAHSEARSRDMAEAASDWFWEMDENLRFSYFSDRFGAVTGVDPVHVLGKTRADMGKGDIGDEKWRDHLADLEAHRPFREFRYAFYSPDGRTLHLRISGRPVFDADGVFRGYRGVGTDITSRRRAELALRESEERLRAVIDSLVIGVITIDKQGVVQSFSPGAERMFGYAPDEVVGNNIRMLMPEPYHSGHDGYLTNYLNTGEAKIIGKGRVVDGRRKDGSTFPMELEVGEMRVAGRRLFSGVARDITERKQAEDALRESEERFRGAIESLHEGFALYDAEDRLVICNAAYEDLHSGIEEFLVPGARFEDLLNASVERGLLAEAVGREEEFIRERLEKHRNPKGSFERELTDGRWFIVTEGRTPDGGTYATLRDITALKQREAALRESEERFRTVVNHSPVKIHIKDAQGRYTLINLEAEKLYGVTDEEGRGKTCHEIFPQELADSFAVHDQAVLETGQTVEVEEEWQREDSLHTYRTIKFPIRNTAGEIVAVGAIGTDITESKKAEERIRHLATHDVLTGLPNRALGMDRLSQALAMARRNVTMAALVFVDLDGFKGINDTHGHEAGDRVLKEVAGRLRACVRETDTVARFGGDEFLLVLTAMTDKAAVATVVAKVLESLSRSFAVDGRVTPLGASIGIALYPGDGETPEELFRRADRAMYAAKAEGKNNYRFATREQATTPLRA